ncbi:MAG: hypothetical protein IPJ62_18065 [Betaproteobacteria bacterium]|nr:hypothetical protein [Betaproteobacteria bacterium]
MSAATSVESPLRNAPGSTMSISAAPSSMASAVARAFAAVRSQPCGNATTETTRAGLTASPVAARFTQHGCTQ